MLEEEFLSTEAKVVEDQQMQKTVLHCSWWFSSNVKYTIEKANNERGIPKPTYAIR